MLRYSPLWYRFSIRFLVLVGLLVLPAPVPAVDDVVETLGRRFFPEADRIGEFEGTPRAAPVYGQDRVIGYLFLTDDIAPIPAYSGKPISTLVGLAIDGRITGIEIVAHSEPILQAGVSEQELARYAAQYRGKHVHERLKIGGLPREGYTVIDGLSGATITAMVLNATIVQSTKQIAASRAIPFEAGAATASTRGKAAAPPQAEAAQRLWVEVWEGRTFRIAVLGIGLFLLTAILVFQDWLVRHPTLLVRLRIGFLIYTLFFIGWYGLAQLSVINVITFVNAMMHNFEWGTFLIDPMMFILWSFVAVTILLWGRGVYCGWLCPFGALQELVNKIAIRLHVPQLEIPAMLHERLLAIKYMILLALFAVSLQSMSDAVRYAEVEPFKTAINMHFLREVPYVVYGGVLVLLAVFNGKFYCKYLCGLGAALTIPSHFRIFDWLRRKKECGRPCQVCAKECASQAIRPTGEINPNECHYCLDCQVTYYNNHKCPPLVERRKVRERQGVAAGR